MSNNHQNLKVHYNAKMFVIQYCYQHFGLHCLCILPTSLFESIYYIRHKEMLGDAHITIASYHVHYRTLEFTLH